MKGRENFKVTFKAGSHRVLSGIIAARRRANLKSWLKQILEVRGKNRPQEPRQVQTLTGQGRQRPQGQGRNLKGQDKVSGSGQSISRSGQSISRSGQNLKRHKAWGQNLESQGQTSRSGLSFKAWPKDRSNPELHSWQRPHKVKKQFDIYVHTDKRVSNEL